MQESVYNVEFRGYILTAQGASLVSTTLLQVITGSVWPITYMDVTHVDTGK